MAAATPIKYKNIQPANKRLPVVSPSPNCGGANGPDRLEPGNQVKPEHSVFRLLPEVMMPLQYYELPVLDILETQQYTVQ